MSDSLPGALFFQPSSEEVRSPLSQPQNRLAASSPREDPSPLGESYLLDRLCPQAGLLRFTPSEPGRASPPPIAFKSTQKSVLT